MKLSTKGRYATRIMVCLAVRHLDGRGGPESPVRKQQIAESEGISEHYLEQLLVKLKAAGLVVSRRGVKGGFTLSRDPADITVAQVVEAMEGTIALAPCDGAACARASECVARSVWEAAGDALRNVLDHTTIRDMAEQVQHLRQKESLTYQI